MSANSSIEWTDTTWNPLVAFRAGDSKRGWHCTKVSKGCANCFAESINMRLGTGLPYVRESSRKVSFALVRLFEPLKWRRARRVFVNSMTDLFHEDVDFEWIHQVFVVMNAARKHVFQVLTKRPERMLSFFEWEATRDPDGWASAFPLPNVMLGVSVEDQESANARVPILLKCPAAYRFLSVEPLLAPLTLREYLMSGENPVHWVIVGGESGPKARGCPILALESIVNQCRGCAVPVFVKQMGHRPVLTDTVTEEVMTRWGDARVYPRPQYGGFLVELKDNKGGDMAEWPETLRVRQFPEGV